MIDAISPETDELVHEELALLDATMERLPLRASGGHDWWQPFLKVGKGVGSFVIANLQASSFDPSKLPPESHIWTSVYHPLLGDDEAERVHFSWSTLESTDPINRYGDYRMRFGGKLFFDVDSKPLRVRTLDYRRGISIYGPVACETVDSGLWMYELQPSDPNIALERPLTQLEGDALIYDVRRLVASVCDIIQIR